MLIIMKTTIVIHWSDCWDLICWFKWLTVSLSWFTVAWRCCWLAGTDCLVPLWLMLEVTMLASMKLSKKEHINHLWGKTSWTLDAPVNESALLMMAVVVAFAGIVHFNRCCSTSGLFAVTSFHIFAISSLVQGSPSGNAMHITRNLSLLTGWICWPFWITTLMLADVIGERVPDDGRTRYLSGAVVFT